MKLSEKELEILGLDTSDNRQIYSIVRQKLAILKESEIRARMTDDKFIKPDEQKILEELARRAEEAIYKPARELAAKRAREREEAKKRHEENESKFPEHQLEFIRDITIGFGSRWVTVIKDDEDVRTKPLYKCKVCELFYNDKNTYYKCRGLQLGESRETPYIKAGKSFTNGNDCWKVTQFFDNRIAVIPEKLSTSFDSYLDIGREYFLNKLSKYDDWELWEIGAEQMKRETSQVLLAINEDGSPTLDLDS